jgi:hypothetical protein
MAVPLPAKICRSGRNSTPILRLWRLVEYVGSCQLKEGVGPGFKARHDRPCVNLDNVEIELIPKPGMADFESTDAVVSRVEL